MKASMWVELSEPLCVPTYRADFLACCKGCANDQIVGYFIDAKHFDRIYLVRENRDRLRGSYAR